MAANEAVPRFSRITGPFLGKHVVQPTDDDLRPDAVAVVMFFLNADRPLEGIAQQLVSCPGAWDLPRCVSNQTHVGPNENRDVATGIVR